MTQGRGGEGRGGEGKEGGKGKERKGKERKGKERKGKERKGKERKGKERKGKERKGKEREGKGREGKGREGKGREGKGREGKGREGKGREGKGREGKGREGKGREGKGRKGREGKGREGKGREGKGRGREGKGREGKGREGREGKGREGKEGKEGKGREGKGREGKGREGKGREGKGREGKGREGKGREGKGREGKGREGKGREGREGKGRMKEGLSVRVVLSCVCVCVLRSHTFFCERSTLTVTTAFFAAHPFPKGVTASGTERCPSPGFFHQGVPSFALTHGVLATLPPHRKVLCQAPACRWLEGLKRAPADQLLAARLHVLLRRPGVIAVGVRPTIITTAIHKSPKRCRSSCVRSTNIAQLCVLHTRKHVSTCGWLKRRDRTRRTDTGSWPSQDPVSSNTCATQVKWYPERSSNKPSTPLRVRTAGPG